MTRAPSACPDSEAGAILHQRRRVARPLLAGAAVVLAAVLTGAVLIGAGATGPRATRAREGAAGERGGAQTSVRIASAADGTTVPASFLGVSFESWGLPLFERHGALLARTLSLLRAPGGAPLIVRVGGNSTDRTFWDPTGRRLAPWAFGLTPRYFRQIAELVRRTGARILFDLNLATATATASVQVAAAAEGLLPHGSIMGFEVGNEPDHYDHAGWLAKLSRHAHGFYVVRRPMSPARYVADFDAYARMLAPIAPRTPLVGPAVGYPLLDASWISKLLDGRHPRLALVSAHLYPYTACAQPGSPNYPTVDRLLSEHASAGLARLIAPGAELADHAGLALRVTELNSVSCGGRPGVSDSFASALWAPDALFELLRAGVDGVNIHVRAEAVNGAFALSSHGLLARPLLYGLSLFTRTLGPGARLVQTQQQASSSGRLKVWAVRLASGKLHVLLIDKGRRSTTVRLRLATSATATLQRLLAAGPGSRSGVTLDGQRLGSDGRWHGRSSPEAIRPAAHGYTVTLAPYSAALLSVPG